METPERPLATAVGNQFVKQYYYVMESFPAMLPKFYQDNSAITRIGNDGTMRNNSLLDIGGRLNTLSSGGFDSVVVANFSSQDCTGGSVMVVVNGYFTLKESVEKNFSQTFLLAPQKEGYFVFTDLFISLEKPKGTKVDSKASIPPANNETGVARSEVAGDELKDVSKLSYASAVMKEKPKNQSHHSSCNPSPRREAPAVVDRGDNNNQKSRGIFLKNLSPNTTNTTIENAFQQFGEVSKVANRLHRAHRLVFFKEEDAVQKAIEASPIMINRSQVTVEILRPNWGIIR